MNTREMAEQWYLIFKANSPITLGAYVTVAGKLVKADSMQDASNSNKEANFVPVDLENMMEIKRYFTEHVQCIKVKP